MLSTCQVRQPGWGGLQQEPHLGRSVRRGCPPGLHPRTPYLAACLRGGNIRRSPLAQESPTCDGNYILYPSLFDLFHYILKLWHLTSLTFVCSLGATRFVSETPTQYCWRIRSAYWNICPAIRKSCMNHAWLLCCLYAVHYWFVHQLCNFNAICVLYVQY